MKYPKIQTLYNRDTQGNYGVIPGQLRCPEFELVKEWLITEKIDGRNHRVMLFPDGHIEHRGRTDRAQFADFMLEGAKAAVDEDLMREVIDQNENGTYPMTIFYGELYGPKIQGGGKYRNDIDFALFDIRIGNWWLRWKDVHGMANSLGLDTVWVMGRITHLPESKEQLQYFFHVGSYMATTDGIEPEGIVARTDPLLFDRCGERVMWKLKLKDFKGD